jgi:hypothetical protein
LVDLIHAVNKEVPLLLVVCLGSSDEAHPDQRVSSPRVAVNLRYKSYQPLDGYILLVIGGCTPKVDVAGLCKALSNKDHVASVLAAWWELFAWKPICATVECLLNEPDAVLFF